jgi:hypothetical protein
MNDSQILENDGYGIYLSTEKSSLSTSVDTVQKHDSSGLAFD